MVVKSHYIYYYYVVSFYSQKKIIDKNNPIDFIEEYVVCDEKHKLRDSRDEITILTKGLWNSYNISFKWNNQKRIIEVNSYFETYKKDKVKNSIYSLISSVNQKVTVGFFNFCPKLNTIFYSYNISIKGQNFLSLEQVHDFIDIVTSECDRFFPVFFIYLYKKQNPKNAIEIALVDTRGEA